MADSSLDDIIKQRNIRPLLQHLIRPNMNDEQEKKWISTTGNMNQTTYSNLNIEHKVMGDVRNKIILKKRLRLRDARDRLAELAKQGDARDRLNMIRRKSGSSSKKTTGPWKNNAPARKDIRNENRPSNLGGKTRMYGSSLTRTVSGGGGVTDSKVVRMRGKSGPHRTSAHEHTRITGRSSDSGRYHPLLNNPHVVTIKNEKADMRNSPYPPEFNSPRMPMERPQQLKYAPRPFIHPVSRPFAQPVMRPAPHYDGRSGMVRARSPGPQHIYRPRSPLQQEVRPTRLKITTPNNYKEPSPLYSDEWELVGRPPVRVAAPRMPPSRIPDSPPRRQAVSRAPAKKRPVYEEEDMNTSRPKKMNPLSSGLLARLDQPQRIPTGFKVLVTNLHPCVSVDDMEELFGTIGPILTARMLKQGVAEALFVNKEDAIRSVEVFNNRQLDGQPMCVTVVSRAGPTSSLLSSTHPSSQTNSVLKAASGSLSGSVSRAGIMRATRSRMEEVVAPDITAIHQALFNRHQPPASNHTFLVKLPKQPARN